MVARFRVESIKGSEIVITCYTAMLLFYLVFALGFIIQCECKERKASLVILPPLIMGYDELSYSYETRDENIPPKVKEKLSGDKAMKQMKNTKRNKKD